MYLILLYAMVRLDNGHILAEISMKYNIISSVYTRECVLVAIGRRRSGGNIYSDSINATRTKGKHIGK